VTAAYDSDSADELGPDGGKRTKSGRVRRRRGSRLNSVTSYCSVDHRSCRMDPSLRCVSVSSASQGSVDVDFEHTTAQCDSQRARAQCDSQRARAQCDSQHTTAQCDSQRARVQSDSQHTTAQCDSQRARAQCDSQHTTAQCDSQCARAQCDSQHAAPLQLLLFESAFLCLVIYEFKSGSDNASYMAIFKSL